MVPFMHGKVRKDVYKRQQLTNVLQAVITNKDADIQKLMDTANSNYQKTLDSEFKKN